MSAHTPGPWKLEESETESNHILGKNGIQIADVFYGDMEDGKSNSILIASAPDLLEACKLMLPGLKEKGMPFAVVESAISKAEGRE